MDQSASTHLDSNSDRKVSLFDAQARKQSYDGTVVLPDTIMLATSEASRCFPVFESGDVIIQTTIGSFPRTFQLHSTLLCQHSDYFAREMGSHLSNDVTYRYSFSIEEIDGEVKLLRQHTTGNRPDTTVFEAPVAEPPDIKIKEYSSDDEADGDDYDHVRTVVCYAQILATFYAIGPRISSTNITVALKQCKALLKIANHLGCAHLLRPYLGNALATYRKVLFEAIKDDPPRWLALAIKLQNKQIYAECIVHLVGAHPKWPWPTARATIPDNVQRMVQRKAVELDSMRVDVERELLLINIIINGPLRGTLHPPNLEESSEICTWLVVKVFQDELANHIRKVENHNDRSLYCGKLYRGVAKGTHKWMGTEHVRNLCEKVMRMDKHETDEVAQDTTILRKAAARIVKKLATNELMIDPEEYEVGYLTCTKVGDADSPWPMNSVE